MIVIYAIIVAFCIVSAQALWKFAMIQFPKEVNLVSVDGVMKLASSLPLWSGVMLYGLATFLYLILVGKYNFYQVQAVVVGGSLILSTLMAVVIFKEQPSIVNCFGILLMIFGLLLVLRQ